MIVIDKFKSIIFPAQCYICNKLVGEVGAICSQCWLQIDFVSGPACSICGCSFEFEFGENMTCGGCIKDPPYYDKAHHLFEYNEYSKKLIHNFKYRDKIFQAKYFANWLASRIKVFENADYLVPVPIHRRKMLMRFYNQAALLTRELSPIVGVTNKADLLMKTKFTKPQTGLRAAERRNNVKNVFAVKPKYQDLLKGKNIILVDDVFTTGSTVNECSKALKNAGAKEVVVITLGKTPD